MSETQFVVFVLASIVFALVFYFLYDLKARLEVIESRNAEPPESHSEEICVVCAKDTVDRLERRAEEASALLERLELAEERSSDRLTTAIHSAILKYETDIRRLRELAATQQRSIDHLNYLSRRDYKADVEAGVFEHLAALARDRANALAGKGEL